MLHVLRVFKRKARFVNSGKMPGDYGKVSARNIRAERMTSSVDLPFMDDMPSVPVYDAYTMGVEKHRRQRRTDRYHPAVGTHDTGRIRAVSRDGVSGVTACVALVCLFCVLGVACLVDRSNVVEAGKRVSAMETSIEEIRATNEELSERLAESSSEIVVGYEAVQLGMIHARGVDVIYISAPESANLTLANADAVGTEYLATILGD